MTKRGDDHGPGRSVMGQRGADPNRSTHIEQGKPTESSPKPETDPKPDEKPQSTNR